MWSCIMRPSSHLPYRPEWSVPIKIVGSSNLGVLSTPYLLLNGCSFWGLSVISIRGTGISFEREHRGSGSQRTRPLVKSEKCVYQHCHFSKRRVELIYEEKISCKQKNNKKHSLLGTFRCGTLERGLLSTKCRREYSVRVWTVRLYSAICTTFNMHFSRPVGRTFLEPFYVCVSSYFNMLKDENDDDEYPKVQKKFLSCVCRAIRL